MRILLSVFCFCVTLSGCTEILRQPSLSIDMTSDLSDRVTYRVTALKADPEIVSQANKHPFERQVVVGGSGVGAVKRVSERSLFSGPKPPSNVKIPYVVGTGDTLSVIRTGFTDNSLGVSSRRLTKSNYLVDEAGFIKLVEGAEIKVKGLTISQTTEAVQSALGFDVGTHLLGSNRDSKFPTSKPPLYKLGIGDIVEVSRLNEVLNKDGFLEARIEKSVHKVGPDGFVSILKLGEVRAAGASLAQLRDQVIQQSVNNSGGIDTVVEIKSFASQTALLTGDLGTSIVQISDKPLSFDKLIAGLGPSFAENRDYRVSLVRDGRTYHTNAKSIISGEEDRSFVFDGDVISISEILPESDVLVQIEKFAARSLNYLRVTANDDALVHQGKTIPIDATGIDLRQLLVSQGVDVTLNKDLLITLNRENDLFKISAQAAVIKNPNIRYWLKADDHITVEDIPYIGEAAFLVGEIGAPTQLALNRHQRTTLADALFKGAVFGGQTADFRHIYVLRGEGVQYDAFHFDLTEILNLNLAEKFELRPGDIMFVRTRPLTKYSRALSATLSVLNSIDAGITSSRTFGR